MDESSTHTSLFWLSPITTIAHGAVSSPIIPFDLQAFNLSMVSLSSITMKH